MTIFSAIPNCNTSECQLLGTPHLQKKKKEINGSNKNTSTQKNTTKSPKHSPKKKRIKKNHKPKQKVLFHSYRERPI